MEQDEAEKVYNTLAAQGFTCSLLPPVPRDDPQSTPRAFRSIVSFRRLGRCLGLAPTQTVTQMGNQRKSYEKVLIPEGIRTFWWRLQNSNL